MQTSRVLIRTAPSYEPTGVPAAHVSPAEPDPSTPAVHASPQGSTPFSAMPGLPRHAGPARRQGAVVGARHFATSTATMLLEVLDGRRAVAHLEPLVASKVLETVAGLCRVGVRRRDPAAAATTIRRVHVQMLGPAVAEVFGSYTRDDRTLAFAGRIERVPRRVRSGVTGRAGAAGSGSPSPGFARTGFAGGLAKVEYRWQLVELDLC